MRILLFLVAALWTVFTVTWAYTGVKLVPQLVILGLVSVSGLLQVICWQKSWRRYLAAPVVVLGFLAAAVASLVQLGVWLFPPVTEDGHGVMAIGQTFVGMAGGFLLCAVLSWLYFTRLKPDPRWEAVWIWGLNLALAVAFVVDLML